jgi:hypothetical protein
VVAPNGDAGTAAGGELLGSVVDRAGAVERGRLAADGTAGGVDDRALLAEDERDPLAAAAARTASGNVPRRLTARGRPSGTSSRESEVVVE